MIRSCFLLLAFALSSTSPAGTQGEQSASQGLQPSSQFDGAAVQASYQALCENSGLTHDDLQTLCAEASRHLLYSTLKRGISLQQLLGEQNMACVLAAVGLPEHCDNYYELMEAIDDALAIALCRMDTASIETDEVRELVKRGRTIYVEDVALYDCKNSVFLDRPRSEFSAQPVANNYAAVPVLVEQISARIYNERIGGVRAGLALLEPAALERHGPYLLREAAAAQSAVYVEALLDHGVAVDDEEHYFDSPLLRALREGSGTVVKTLLNRGARADVYAGYWDSRLKPALLVAIERHGTDVVALMLAKGAPVNAAEGQATVSAVARAAELNRLDVVKMLFDQEAVLEGRSDGSYLPELPLMPAARGGNPAIFELFLAHGATREQRERDEDDRFDHELIRAAIAGGSDDILQQLFSLGLRIPEHGHEDIFDTLRGSLSSRWHNKFDEPGIKRTPHLHQPSKQLHSLLSQGLDIVSWNDNPARLVSRLIGRRLTESLDSHEPRARELAQERQRFAMLVFNMYLEQGVDLSGVDSRGDTLLISATNRGNLAVVQRLLTAGSDTQLKNDKGLTAALAVKEMLEQMREHDKNRYPRLLANYRAISELLAP